MKKIMKLFTVLLLCMGILLGLCACGKNEDKNENNSQNGTVVEEKAKAGYKAPDFEATLLTGEKFVLSEQTGKTVVVNFWATWCGYCVQEMPYFEALSAEYGEDVRFVCVNVGERQEKVENFVESKKFTFDIALDPNGKISALYPTDGIPLTVIVKADGTISEVVSGAKDKATWKTKIDKALKG